MVDYTTFLIHGLFIEELSTTQYINGGTETSLFFPQQTLPLVFQLVISDLILMPQQQLTLDK